MRPIRPAAPKPYRDAEVLLVGQWRPMRATFRAIRAVESGSDGGVQLLEAEPGSQLRIPTEHLALIVSEFLNFRDSPARPALSLADVEEAITAHNLAHVAQAVAMALGADLLPDPSLSDLDAEPPERPTLPKANRGAIRRLFSFGFFRPRERAG